MCADLSKLLYKEGINDIRIRSWGCLTYDRDEAEKWGQSSSPTTLHFSVCVYWRNMSWVSLFLISRSKRWNFVLTMHHSNETKLGTEFRTPAGKKTVYRRFRQIKSMAVVWSVSKGKAFISHLKRKQRAESDRRPRRTLALTTVTSSYIFFTLRKTCRNIDLQFSWLRHHLTWKKEGNISLSKKGSIGARTLANQTEPG